MDILKLWPVIVVVIVLGAFLGFSFYATPTVFASPKCKKKIELLKWVKTADAIKDAQQALKEEDTLYKAVRGYNLSIPGVSKKMLRGKRRKSYVVLNGTSDATCNKTHKALNEKAREYAKQYNAVIVEHMIQKNKEKKAEMYSILESL